MWQNDIIFTTSPTDALSARDVIQDGMIWRVGNGESVWIKVDRWLPNQACCSVISPLPQLANDTRVSFLIDQDRFAWKESVVKELFLPHEADIILGIPLSFWHPPDRIAWAQTPTGMFSTSSAYKLIVSGASTSIAGSSNLDNQRKFWKGLWQLRVPNKIKLFVWRAYNDALPTMENLH